MGRELIVISGPDSGRRFPLTDGQTLVVGRGQASDTVIDDRHMSRVHCQVIVDGAKTLLVDSGSSAGTLIDGKQAERHELQPGDIFTVGRTQIQYQLDKPRADATTPSDQAFGRPKPKPKVPPLADLVGHNLAHYRLEKVITPGASGMIFKAHDTQHNRVAAVKVLSPELTDSDEQKQRFVRAMKTMLPISQDNIVRLYNAGKTGPHCWAAMEYIDGESLSHVIDRIGIEGMLDWREVWRVAVHISRALREAYERKIIHRNVTPTNILRRNKDRLCLLGDLMLAKALEGTLSQQVTRPGQLIGDVPYMPPERTREQAGVDGRSDIYGLGATLYALLTGRAPFEDSSLPELVRRVRQEQPRKPTEFQASIDKLFQDLVLKMIAKQPEDRFQTPNQILTELERIGRNHNLEADWTEWSG